MVRAQYDDASTSNRMFYYSGFFGGTEKVEFNLQINGVAVSGSYIIERTGGLFTFSGRMASDKSGIGLIIFDEENEYVATIEAKMISEDNNFAKEIKGKWKSADGKKQIGLSLKKVAELAGIQENNSGLLYGFTFPKDVEILKQGFEPLEETISLASESEDIRSSHAIASENKCLLVILKNMQNFPLQEKCKQ